MSWRRAALYWVCFGMLATYYVLALREPPQNAAAHLTRAVFLNLPEEQVASIDIRRSDASVRCRRSNGRWQVVEPQGMTVPSDLIAALVANLTELPDVEVVADTNRDAVQFGLDTPASEITLTATGGAPITVRLGVRNPARTAVYAQRSDSPRVFLIGLNVRYYEELLFEALRRRGEGGGQ